jgi:hypothetical protein
MDEPPAAARRRVLKAALGGAVAVGAVSGAVRWWPDDGSDGGSAGTLVLAGDGTDQISSVEVSLDDERVSRSASGWQTSTMSTSVYSMLALTWDDLAAAPVLDVRTRRKGTWSHWRRVSLLHDRPDEDDAAETVSRGGSELVWIGRADGVQVRGAGSRVRGLRLLLMQPWRQPGDDAPEPLARASAAVSVPKPYIRGRRQWHADESWRDGSPRYNRTIQQVHVHHTANSNDYRREDVPALLRGIYRYHTRYMGWSDVGYNFLVDRFGRIWTGRAGGAGRPVRGAHTLGFNATSTGISVIGNFETARPSSAVLDAIAKIAAWKLGPYGRDPEGLVRVYSEGSDKYRVGRTVTLPVIDGHRNTNDTACPGDHLYHAIPEIRRRTAQLLEYYSKVHVLERPTLTGEPALGHTLRVEGGRYDPGDAAVSYTWLRSGTPIAGAHEASYVVRPADAGSKLAVRVVARNSGMQPAQRTLWTSRRVTVASSVTLMPHARGDGRLRIDVRVSSPDGVATATGEVIVKVADRRLVVNLVDGHAIAKFGWVRPLDPGRYAVRAWYAGDRAHQTDGATIRARVRR